MFEARRRREALETIVAAYGGDAAIEARFRDIPAGDLEMLAKACDDAKGLSHLDAIWRAGRFGPP